MSGNGGRGWGEVWSKGKVGGLILAVRNLPAGSTKCASSRFCVGPLLRRKHVLLPFQMSLNLPAGIVVVVVVAVVPAALVNVKLSLLKQFISRLDMRLAHTWHDTSLSLRPTDLQQDFSAFHAWVDDETTFYKMFGKVDYDIEEIDEIPMSCYMAPTSLK